MMSKTFAKGWYAVLPVIELKDKPLAITRLGVDLVVWRDNKQNIIVMHDSCPHRSAKLSLGKICNDEISCPFHGFRFVADGSCSYAPEFDKSIPGLKVKTYPVEIAIAMVWVYFGEVSEPIKIDVLRAIESEFKANYSFTNRVWSSHITRCIENQLDYTHLPIVHHNTIGRNFKMPINPKFIKTPDGIKSFHRDKLEEPSSEYIFPNTWILNVSNKMKLIVYFVPITENKTKFYLFTYRKFLTYKLLKPLIDLLFNYTNQVILKQDQKVVESQGCLPSYLASTEVLMRHDVAIRMFRELWQNKS